MNGQGWREIAADDTFVTDPRQWLASYAREDMPWLLAHADDGVIWGQREGDGTLSLSSDAFADPNRHPAIAVPLRAQTLQQVRVFGPGGELLVWRTQNGFAARLIEDGPQPPPDALPDEGYLLWSLGGIVETREGFTLLQEGQQGLRHALPITPPIRSRPALVVRHYLDYDDEGQAYVCLSRLVDLKV
jgi:CRISPR-associated protein (TIGR03984 family)